jgi:hypothetical protein
VTIPLNTVVANADGTESATTTIKDVTPDKLLGDDQHRFILLHAEVKKGQGFLPASPAPSFLKGLPTPPSRTCLRAAGRRPECCSLSHW